MDESIGGLITTSPELIPSPFDDDAFKLTASIKNAYLKDSYTVYLINVSLICRPQQRWEIEKRFKEFSVFDEAIKKLGWSIGALPEKKWFGNKDREFVSKRQMELENYLNAVLSVPQLNFSDPVRAFLYPDCYIEETSEISDTGKQQIALTLRSEPRFLFVRFLPQIGWRRRKVFALACNSAQQNEHFMVCWTEFCQKNACYEPEVGAVLKWLQGQRNDSMDSILAPFSFSSLTNRAVLTLQLLNSPALRDILRSIEHPLDEPYLKKYSQQRAFALVQNLQRGFSKETFFNMVRSILANFTFFLAHYHSQGLFFMNLHAGNVIVDLKPDRHGNFRCRFAEAHSAVLGILPPYYMDLLQLGPGCIRSVFDADMAAMGLLLEDIMDSRPQNWQIPVDLTDVQAKLRPANPNSSPASASELIQLLRAESTFEKLLDSKSSFSLPHFFDPPSPEIVQIFAKARAGYERRLSLHHAIFYQVHAVKNVRRSLVTSNKSNNNGTDPEFVHSGTDSIIFAK